MSIRISPLVLVAAALSVWLAGCRTPSPDGRQGDATYTPVAAMTRAAPTATAAVPQSGDVAALIREPPDAMTPVEITAYHGDGFLSWPGRGRGEQATGCPSAELSPLTDRPLWLTLAFGGTMVGNPVPAGAPYLIAAGPGEGLVPDLPLRGRLRGHLGDERYAHCPDAERIFVVEEVLESYEEKRGFPPRDDDVGSWPRYLDPGGRFELRYPPEWQLKERSPDDLALRAERWPASPIDIRAMPAPYAPTPRPDMPPVTIEETGFLQRPPEETGPSNVPPLWAAVHHCGGHLGDGCIEIVFRGRTTDYVLTLQYPTGFDAHPETLLQLEGIAHAFQVLGRATVTPTPLARDALGPGPFLERERAEEKALDMIPYGPWEATDARLVPEAEALTYNLCDMRREEVGTGWYAYPEGVWIVELTGTFEGRDTVFHTYLDAVTGFHLCTAEAGTRPGAGRLP